MRKNERLEWISKREALFKKSALAVAAENQAHFEKEDKPQPVAAANSCVLERSSFW